MDSQTILRNLEDSGLRCTPQRFSVMSFLLEYHGHPTAAEIFEGVTALTRNAPRSSRATTYNNLRDLVQAGLVREVAVEGRAARFDITGERHHHFICDACGNVEDMDWYSVPRPAADSLGKRVVHLVELIVRGLCAKCARPKTATRKASTAKLLPPANPRGSNGRSGLQFRQSSTKPNTRGTNGRSGLQP